MTTVNKDAFGQSDELRIAIRCTTTDIPGLQSDRGSRVADDFAMWTLSRHFSYDTDFIHLPAEIDGDIQKSVWILCDFNVRERRSVLDVPIQFWKANYGGTESASVIRQPFLGFFLTSRVGSSKNIGSQREGISLTNMHGGDTMGNGNTGYSEGRGRYHDLNRKRAYTTPSSD
jgi:hypothetical protein